jgi:hypothetical protein
MPADSIGGTTNLVTKSALDFKDDVLTYRVGLNYNAFRDDLQNPTPNAALTYLTRVGRERDLGLALSLSYTDTEAPRDRVQTVRNQPDGRATRPAACRNVQRARAHGGRTRVRLSAGPEPQCLHEAAVQLLLLRQPAAGVCRDRRAGPTR